MSKSAFRYRLGIDIGGTFTDLHAMEEPSGRLFALKVPSNREDPSSAVVAGVRELESRFGIHPGDITYFAHGTTLAVNTLLERNGARGGVLMTKGFTDTLVLRRLRLSKANDFFVPKPVPLIPRRHSKPIDERLRANGAVLKPIRKEDVLEQTQELIHAGAETIAICFLHAHQNPVHEQQAKNWIEENFPDTYVCTSSEIWPQQREYERSLVSVINAYVGARMKTYFHTLESRTRALGMTCRVFSTKSNGGVMSVASAAERPVDTLLSGPASGVIGAAFIGKLIGDTRLVTLDMGGTSVDVSVIDDEIRYSSENTIGDFPVIMPAVDVSAVGAGGGSMAWADTEGVLKVGLESAGATPGPACYNRGGTRPTVTDAYLAAGIIAPDRFLGGEMQLEPTLAEKSIDQLGEQLGLSRQATADAIIQVTTSNIYAELLPQLARRGVDVTDFSLLAYGAAGPTQVFMLARDLNLRRVIIPPSPGILCALGCLVADVRADFVHSIWKSTSELSDQTLRDIFTELDTQARDWLATQQVDLQQVYVLRSADMCYVGQSYEVNVPFPDIKTPTLTATQVTGWFHRKYAKVYGYTEEQSPTRMLEARLQIVGVTPKPDVHLITGQPSASSSSQESRTVFENGQSFEATVLQRGQLESGKSYPGPVIIEQYDTTVYVPQEFCLHVDRFANLIGERAS